MPWFRPPWDESQCDFVSNRPTSRSAQHGSFSQLCIRLLVDYEMLSPAVHATKSRVEVLDSRINNALRISSAAGFGARVIPVRLNRTDAHSWGNRMRRPIVVSEWENHWASEHAGSISTIDYYREFITIESRISDVVSLRFSTTMNDFFRSR